MEWKLHNIYGWIHMISAILAIVSTWFIFAWKKGTVQHKRAGYFFVVNMLILNFSSFGVMMQNNGKPGPFHVLTIVSLVFLMKGMIPVLRKKNKNWLRQHYYGINGAVIGLYAAFFVEATFRTLQPSCHHNTYTWIILFCCNTWWCTDEKICWTFLQKLNMPMLF